MQSLLLSFILCLSANNILKMEAQASSVIAIIKESENVGVGTGGTVAVEQDTESVIKLAGFDLREGQEILFTTAGEEDDDCSSGEKTESFSIESVVNTSESVDSGTYGTVSVKLGSRWNRENLYICLKVEENRLKHQGSEPWLTVTVEPPLLPLWLQIMLIAVLLLFSGLFSGLNLGLMALDPTELKILQNCGRGSEKKYAKQISPIRKTGNYLLCTLLLGNVLVNSTLTVLLDDLSSGLFAVIGATAGIVIFGEIVPQSICSRHGLAIGARTLLITKFFMVLTFPISWPISKILDLILGQEIGQVYNRERLLELIKVTDEYNDLQKEEVDMISGALELKRKTVLDVMTPLSDCFMLDEDAVLDFKTVTDIMHKGFTRIPVYSKTRDNITALLFVKDLAFVDPDDCTPLKTVVKFYKHPINFVFDDTTLDIMLTEFKRGESHMAIVNRVNSEGEGDPFYEVLGLVTLEDVIEELIKADIVDETDQYVDIRTKKSRRDHNYRRDYSVFAEQDDVIRPKITPQLALATFQFLSTEVKPFQRDYLSETVLHRLLQQDIIYNENLQEDEPTFLFSNGKAVDYFIMILQGRVEVTIGKENLIFEQGPFAYFGQQALMSQTDNSSMSPASTPSTPGSMRSNLFKPDFTVRLLSDTQFIRVTASQYRAALVATKMEQEVQGTESSSDVFSHEWQKAQKKSTAGDEEPEKAVEALPNNGAVHDLGGSDDDSPEIKLLHKDPNESVA